MWDLESGFFSEKEEVPNSGIRKRGLAEWNREKNYELLKSDKIKEFIAKGFITEQRVMALRENRRLNLSSEGIIKLIDYGIISLAQALELELAHSKRYFLSAEGIFELIINQFMSLDQALKLSDSQELNLESRGVQHLLAKRTITLDQALALSENQRLNLSSKGIVKLIDHGIINLAEALEPELEDSTREFLSKEWMFGLINRGVISFAQALELELDNFKQDFLSIDGVYKLIVKRIIRFDQVLNLNNSEQLNLESSGVRELLSKKIITLDQALALNESQCRALSDRNTVLRIIMKELNIRQFIGASAPPLSCINHSQSTHTASVHYSASESAEKLRQRYADKICKKSSLEKKFEKSRLKNIIRKLDMVSKSSLEKTLREIKAFADALPDNDPRKKVARRCIKRITDLDDNFIDPSSKLSMKELLALSFTAIRDNNYHQREIEDAENQFIAGLVEIQRGYNSSDTEKDKPICASGAFNKFIESLQGIHPDCNIQYITTETASLKLPIIVREELDNYLSNLINSGKTEVELVHFEKLLRRAQRSGNFKSFLEKIEENIAIRILDEFASLYPSGKSDLNFIELISYSKEVDVSAVLEKNLVDLQKKKKSFSCYNSMGEAENELFVSDRPETGAISRRRSQVAVDPLPLISEMTSLSLTPDQFDSASYSSGMVRSNFWQPGFTAAEDSDSFETSDLCKKN